MFVAIYGIQYDIGSKHNIYTTIALYPTGTSPLGSAGRLVFLSRFNDGVGIIIIKGLKEGCVTIR